VNSTGCPAGTGVALAEVVLVAGVQPLSSKPGSDSGFSGAYFQPVRAGRVSAGGAASGERDATLPADVREVGTGLPFHRTRPTGRGPHTSSVAAAVVSPVSSRTGPRSSAERTSSGPLTMTGPALVSSRQKVAAAVSSISTRSSGRAVPPGSTRTWVTPLWV
jgi:hypothetical protein